MECALRPLTTLDGLEARWRALEAAATPRFFNTWTYLGCQFSRRFTRPLLLCVRANGEDLALGLLGRRRDGAHLHSGGGTLDRAVFPEHAGLLLRTGEEAALGPALACLGGRAVRLYGVDDAHLRAAEASGEVVGLQTRWAPAADLAALPADPVDGLSANARGQIRRALRLAPAARLEGAPDPATGLRWFGELVRLHAARWAGRGGGAFATADSRAFHETLLGRALPRGEAELLRVSAASGVLGYLYILRSPGAAHVYQSGFAAAADPRHKPGLVCHALAMAHYRAQGIGTYDLMAGDDRYKRTLAGEGGQALHWFTLYPKGSWRARAWRAAAGLKARARGAIGGGGRP